VQNQGALSSAGVGYTRPLEQPGNITAYRSAKVFVGAVCTNLLRLCTRVPCETSWIHADPVSVAGFTLTWSRYRRAEGGGGELVPTGAVADIESAMFIVFLPAQNGAESRL
jgi:hypothetical protein